MLHWQDFNNNNIAPKQDKPAPSIIQRPLDLKPDGKLTAIFHITKIPILTPKPPEPLAHPLSLNPIQFPVQTNRIKIVEIDSIGNE